MTETIYSKSPANTIDSFPPRRSGRLLFGLVILLFALARLWRLTSSCLWFDEIFSVHAAEHSWRNLVHFVADDLVHPPLFYFLLKLWIGIGGESLLWLRLFPALVCIAAIAPIVLLARELGLTRSTTTLALLLMAVNGYLIKYAQEVRMYCVLFFLSACSLWLFVSFVKNSEVSRWRVFALTLVNLLMVYTHYYGWLLVLIELAMIIFVRRRTRHFVLSFAILILAYVPWLIEIARAYQSSRANQNIGWISRPRFGALFDSLTMLHQPFIFPLSNTDARVSFLLIGLVLLAFLVPIALLVWQFKQKKTSDTDVPGPVLLIVFAFAPFLLAGALSWVLPKSIWGTRHLIIAAVPYSLLAAMALVHLREYWVRAGVFLIIGCWFLATALYVIIKPPPNYVWCAWNPLAAQLSATAQTQQTVAVYAFEDLVAYHLWFALRDAHAANFRVAVMKGVPGTNEDTEYFLPRDFDDVSIRGSEMPGENHIWIAFRGAPADINAAPLRYFAAAGYEMKTVLTHHAENQDAFLIELRRK